MKEYHFAAPVLRFEKGNNRHYVPIPIEIAEDLLKSGSRRVIATLNGHELRRAVNGNREGERFLTVGIPLLRTIGVKYGDTVSVGLRADPYPDRIDLGEEFETALEQDAEAAERFFAMTPGRRRSLAYYVTSAKREKTRISRALELAHKLRTNTLYSDLN